MRTVRIPMEREPEHPAFGALVDKETGLVHRTLKTDHVLCLCLRSYHGEPLPSYFGLGAVPRDGGGSVEEGGRMKPGPWAYAFGLSTCIAANPDHGSAAQHNRERAAGLCHDVEPGDRLIMDGVTYQIEVYRREYIRLNPVTDEGAEA